MPIYDYVCRDCDEAFEKLWPSASAAQGRSPQCPACSGGATQRVPSQVTVLGGLGGLTPGEQRQAGAAEARRASFTSREQIQSLQANRQRKREQGR